MKLKTIKLFITAITTITVITHAVMVSGTCWVFTACQKGNRIYRNSTVLTHPSSGCFAATVVAK